MQVAMNVGFQYVVAAIVGICFGLLIGGAAVFVTQTAGHAAAVEWASVAPPR